MNTTIDLSEAVIAPNVCEYRFLAPERSAMHSKTPLRHVCQTLVKDPAMSGGFDNLVQHFENSSV